MIWGFDNGIVKEMGEERERERDGWRLRGKRDDKEDERDVMFDERREVYSGEDEGRVVSVE